MSTIDSTPISHLLDSNRNVNNSSTYNPNVNLNTNMNTGNNNTSNNNNSVNSYNHKNTSNQENICNNTLPYTNDEKIRNNFIPNSTNNDYIDNRNEETLQHYENRRYKRNIMTDFLYYQDYIFLVCLYVFFQLPFINNIIILNFSTLGICNADGTMNIVCHTVKAFLLTFLYRICIDLFAPYQ